MMVSKGKTQVSQGQVLLVNGTGIETSFLIVMWKVEVEGSLVLAGAGGSAEEMVEKWVSKLKTSRRN